MTIYDDVQTSRKGVAFDWGAFLHDGLNQRCAIDDFRSCYQIIHVT